MSMPDDAAPDQAADDAVLAQLLAAIENNPELRETLRRHLLTEEVLKLPEGFAQFAHAVLDFNKLIADRTEKMVDGMTSMAQTMTGEAGQLERLTGVFAGLSVTLNNMEVEAREANAHLALLARDSYARQAARRALRPARAILGIGRPRIAHLYAADAIGPVGPDGPAFLFDLAADAEAAGRLTEEQAQDLEQAALIIAGQDDRGEPLYVLAEIALTAQPADVANARRRAALLARAANARARPAVVTAAVTEEAQTEAANDVTLLPVPQSPPPNGNGQT